MSVEKNENKNKRALKEKKYIYIFIHIYVLIKATTRKNEATCFGRQIQGQDVRILLVPAC